MNKRLVIETKRHYKMFKYGKRWVFMAITTLALAGAGSLTTETVAASDAGTATSAATTTNGTKTAPPTTTVTATNSSTPTNSTTKATGTAANKPDPTVGSPVATPAATTTDTHTTSQASPKPGTTAPGSDTTSPTGADEGTDQGANGGTKSTDPADDTNQGTGDGSTAGSTGDTKQDTAKPDANYLYKYFKDQLTYQGADPSQTTLDAIVKDYYKQYAAYQAKGQQLTADNYLATMTDASKQFNQDTSVIMGAANGTLDTTGAGKRWVKTDPPVDADSLLDGDVLKAWGAGYHGEGMVVAVIDDGVEPQKDLRLSDPKSAPVQAEIAKAKQFINQKGYGTYINEKIPFAYNYSGNDDNATGTADEDHGEHVSGIIAANGQSVDKDSFTAIAMAGALGLASNDQLNQMVADYEKGANRYTIGVAPEAQILDLRAIGTESTQRADGIAQAIHDAVDLGANVINMSIGGTYENEYDYNITEEAVKYATDHGVFVSIAASNSDSRADVGAAGGNDYKPENYSTISNPATAPSAMTVAAENDFDVDTYAKTGTAQRTIAPYSSYGPNSDFTLKPDVTAPGSNIKSTEYDDQYQIMQGTSMATPYDSGVALLVMQRLQKEHPELKGADLVQAVKLAIMNSATINKDAAGLPISPRSQGAGSVDVGNAVKIDVSAQGETTSTDGTSIPSGTGSVSLYNTDNGDQFKLLFTNYGDKDVTYTYTPNKVITNAFRTDKNGKLDGSGQTVAKEVVGASISGANSFIVKAHSTAEEAFTFNATSDVAKDQAVEGYLSFNTTTGSNNISVPFLGFYGDLTHENVYNVTGQGLSSYLSNEDALPLGLGSDADAIDALAKNGDTNFANATAAKAAIKGLVAQINKNKVSFSPNADGQSDSITPVVYTTQNLAALTAQIVDANGNVLTTLDNETNLEGGGLSVAGTDTPADISKSVAITGHEAALSWDGTVYDQATGTYKRVADGKYSYRLVATLNYDGANKQQTLDLPFTVDTQAPSIAAPAFDAASGTISLDYSDAGIGFTSATEATITTAAGDIQASLGASTNSGHFTYKLSSDQLAALGKDIKITVHDAAGNTASTTVQTQQEPNAAAASAANTQTPTFQFYSGAPSLSKLIAQSTDGFGVTTDAYAMGFESTDKSGTATLKAKVSGPEGTQYFVRDAITGDVFQGTLDAHGDAIFHVNAIDRAAAMSFSLQGAAFQGYAITPTKEAGVYKQSTIDLTVVSVSDDATAPLDESKSTVVTPFNNPDELKKLLQDPNFENYFLITLDGGYEDSRNTSNLINELNFEIENKKTATGHTIDLKHTGGFSQADAGSADDYKQPDQDILKFDNVTIGSNFMNAKGVISGLDAHGDAIASANDAYDPASGTYTIKGHLNLSGKSTLLGNYENPFLYILGNSTSEADISNKVAVAADGTFSFKVHLDPTQNRNVDFALGYWTKNTDGTTGEFHVVRDALNFITDTELPKLSINNIATGDADTSYLTTTQAAIELNTTAGDNSDGYTVYYNGNQVYRGATAESTGLVGDMVGISTPKDFAYKTTMNLNPGENVITVATKDQLGNAVTKKLIITRITPTAFDQSGNLSTTASTNAAQSAAEAEAAELAALSAAQEAADQAYAQAYAAAANGLSKADTSKLTPAAQASYEKGFAAGAKAAAGKFAKTTPSTKHFAYRGVAKIVGANTQIFDATGHATGRKLGSNTNWSVFAVVVGADGRTYFNLGGNQYIRTGTAKVSTDAKKNLQWAAAGKEDNNQTKVLGVVKVKHVPGRAIIVLKGDFKTAVKTSTGKIKKLAPDTSWKVFGLITHNGKVYFNLGGDQFVEAQYVTFR